MITEAPPFRFAAWECETLQPPPLLSVDRWAEEHVRLPRSVAAIEGKLSLERTPYLREILRASTDPNVEEITICFSTQVGKTTTGILIALYYLAEDPWPCLHVMPREDDAVAINVDRYQKIIEESPRLRRMLTGAANDMTREAIRLNGTALTFAGANSPAALSSRAICLLILDETDKYPEFSGKEASPISLARERTRTFSQRKIIKISTPTTDRGYIWRELLESDQRRYHVPCPHCGGYQQLLMGSSGQGLPGLKWPENERDPERVVVDRLAWYECEFCHGRIEDDHKPAMLSAGVWVPFGQAIDKDGKVEGPVLPTRKIGFHLSALYSPWLTFSQVAEKFLRSKSNPESLMNFRNSWMAEIWEDTVEVVKDADLRACILPYDHGQAPAEAHILTAGVDVQGDHFWYVVRGWGAHGESWLVRCGRVATWEQLDLVLHGATYMTPARDGAVPLKMVMIDARYRTDEVFSYCRHRSYQAVMGASRPLRPFSHSKHNHADGSVSPLVTLDTGHYKTKLHRKIRTPDGSPGAWHLPADTPKEYYVHMTSEQRIRVIDKRSGRVNVVWKIFPPGAPNHLFDCEVLALSGADVFDVEHRFTLPPDRAPEAPSNPMPVEGSPVVASGVKEKKAPPKSGFKRTTSRFFT